MLDVLGHPFSELLTNKNMKQCHKCNRTMTNRHFRLEPKNEDNLSNLCRNCTEYQDNYRKFGKAEPNSLYEYLHTLRSKSSYCMRCGRLFNYVEPEGKRRKRRKLAYKAEYLRGLYLCEECYCDEMHEKKFKVGEGWHLVSEITVKEYNKLYKDYPNPYKEK